MVRDLKPHVGQVLETVPLPRLDGPDTPLADDLPGFAHALAAAIERALLAPPLDAEDGSLRTALAHFTWRAVYQRVERVWNELLGH